MTILQTEDLTKTYGRLKAIDGLSMQLEAGMVYGLLGPNGSGKTTTLGILLGVIRPTAGRFEWFEGKYGANPRRHIGALLETPNFYPYLNAVDNLQLVAHVKRVAEPRIDEWLELVKLSHRRRSKFRTYSLGMKQRLAIAAAMIGDPDVLVFDEPTNGLDPQGIAEVRDTLQQIARRGKTILMASHILDEVEKICSHVAILKEGRLLADGPVGAIIRDEQAIEVAAEDRQGLLELLHSLPEVTEIREENGQLLVLAEKTLAPGAINRLAFERGLLLHHLRVRRRSLEAEFLEITR